MAIARLWGDWDPFWDLDRMRRELSRTYGTGSRTRGAATMRVLEDPEGLTIQVEVPGVDPEQIELTATGDMLTLKGERAADEVPEEARAHRRERWSGSFTRSLSIPSGFDTQQLSASCRDGLLTVRLGRQEAAKPRQIEVRRR